MVASEPMLWLEFAGEVYSIQIRIYSKAVYGRQIVIKRYNGSKGSNDVW